MSKLIVAKIYSVVSMCSTSEPDIIMRMCLSVHKEFHFIKLIPFRNCLDFSFNKWYNAMLISGVSVLAPDSFLFLFLKSEIG